MAPTVLTSIAPLITPWTHSTLSCQMPLTATLGEVDTPFVGKPRRIRREIGTELVVSG
jgi:hypothetical protein